MKYLLLIPLLFLSLSFKPETNPIWIGTIEVYFDSETSEFIVNYNGDYDRCFVKYLIDHIYNDCDSITDTNALDKKLKWNKCPIDTLPIKHTRKTIKM